MRISDWSSDVCSSDLVLVSDQSWEARASTRPAEFEQASGRRRVRYHRGDIRLRRDLAVDQRFARELAHGRALRDELDLEPEPYAGFDRRPAFRLFDRHGIEKHARPQGPRHFHLEGTTHLPPRSENG